MSSLRCRYCARRMASYEDRKEHEEASHRSANQRWYDDHLEKGLCTQCGKVAVNGQTRCEPCKEKNKARLNDRLRS